MSLKKQEPLNLSHHCANFDTYRSCGSGNFITILFCHGIYMITGSKVHVTSYVGVSYPKQPVY